MTLLEVNNTATITYRQHFKNHPQDIALYAPITMHHLRKGLCVCCPDQPDGTCPEGHNLCERCAKSHGCIACGLMG